MSNCWRCSFFLIVSMVSDCLTTYMSHCLIAANTFHKLSAATGLIVFYIVSVSQSLIALTASCSHCLCHNSHFLVVALSHWSHCPRIAIVIDTALTVSLSSVHCVHCLIAALCHNSHGPHVVTVIIKVPTFPLCQWFLHCLAASLFALSSWYHWHWLIVFAFTLSLTSLTDFTVLVLPLTLLSLSHCIQCIVCIVSVMHLLTTLIVLICHCQ